jgi:hypothetical protein
VETRHHYSHVGIFLQRRRLNFVPLPSLREVSAVEAIVPFVLSKAGIDRTHFHKRGFSVTSNVRLALFVALVSLYAVLPTASRAQTMQCTEDGPTVTVSGTISSVTAIQFTNLGASGVAIRASMPSVSCGSDVVVLAL